MENTKDAVYNQKTPVKIRSLYNIRLVLTELKRLENFEIYFNQATAITCVTHVEPYGFFFFIK